MFKNLRKRVSKFMGKRIDQCKEILTSDKNRLVIGLVMIGAGLGLVASVYMKIPA